MFISIIIPTLNEEQQIGSLLKFLSNHPDKNEFEVIIVDGGSTDKTRTLVSQFPVKVESSKECSRACQMNLGAKHAKGNILYFVHADVQLVDSFVYDIKESVNQGYGSGCYRFKFDNPPNPLLHVNGFFTRFPFKWCRGGDQTLFVTKECFEKLGGFDEEYVIMEDYDFLDRMEEVSVSFKIIPKSVKVSARKYENNSYFKVQKANYKAMKMYKSGEMPAEIKKFYKLELL
ncbi:TIGR04283 family arsenosugar biosynthesis glycosyltransferase [Ekhidna sp.]